MRGMQPKVPISVPWLPVHTGQTAILQEFQRFPPQAAPQHLRHTHLRTRVLLLSTPHSSLAPSTPPARHHQASSAGGLSSGCGRAGWGTSREQDPVSGPQEIRMSSSRESPPRTPGWPAHRWLQRAKLSGLPLPHSLLSTLLARAQLPFLPFQKH